MIILTEAHRLFLACIAAGVIAQGLKIILLLSKKHQHFHLKDLVVTGSMPSSHSALVTALALGTLWLEGFSSLFLVSGVLAVIVIRDALGVRRTAGEEGKLLNAVIRKSHFKLPPVHYSLGHTPTEVAVGVVIGVLASFLVLV